MYVLDLSELGIQESEVLYTGDAEGGSMSCCNS